MSTEQLIIELDAKTAKLDAKLKKVERNLDHVDGSTKKVDGSLKKMGNVAGVAGAAILKTAAAATALSAAISAMVISSASGRRELELLATQAKTKQLTSRHYLLQLVVTVLTLNRLVTYPKTYRTK